MTDLQLPNAFEAEQKLLGCFLRDSSSYAKVGAMIEPEDFYNRDHQRIYKAIVGLCQNQKDTDITSVQNELTKQSDNKIERSDLVELAGMVAGAAGILGYAEAVKEKSQYRQLIKTANQVVQSCYLQEQSVSELVSILSQEAVGMLKTEGGIGFKKLSDYTLQAGISVEEYASGRLRGITTGFKSLDDLFGGFQRKEYIIIAARPQHGKTALTYQMGAKQAQSGSKVAYFSAETAGEEFAIRALCTEAKIDSVEWKKGILNSEQTDKITIQMSKIVEWPFWICEAPRIEINMLCTLASHLHKEVGLDIIYVDYIQLLRTSERFRDRREQIDYISVSLKHLAQRLNVPVVVCCQLSREIEKRRNKEPQLSDMKESGGLEQDADVVIMPQRLKLVAPRKEDRKSNLATLYIRKCRNGPTGQIDLIFEEKYTLFTEFETQELPF